MTMRILRIPTVLALAALASGCFHYVPAEDLPSQGASVRVRLSEPVPVELPDVTFNQVMEVRGEMVAVRSDRVFLSAFALVSAREVDHELAGETVSLPREAVAEIEQRRFSFTRSVLAGVAFTAIGFLFDAAIRSTGGGDGGGDGPPIIE